MIVFPGHCRLEVPVVLVGGITGYAYGIVFPRRCRSEVHVALVGGGGGGVSRSMQSVMFPGGCTPEIRD